MSGKQDDCKSESDQTSEGAEVNSGEENTTKPADAQDDVNQTADTAPSQSDQSVNFLERLLSSFSMGGAAAQSEEKEKPEQLLEEVTFEGVAKYIKSDKCKNIVVMTGAGLSTAAGIPDFRSPGTGLYDNLQKYDLPSPQAIFEINFFRSNPEPFFTLAKELYPGQFKPTISHYFIKMLADKKLLLRNYTQNIDTLERIAGVPGDLLVEAHGTFHTAHCLECHKEFEQEWVKNEMFADRIPRCPEPCEGVVKPDIVFFGESLPNKFHQLVPQDMRTCDLLIIMGTSLVVQPFASLVDRVPETVPRLLINMEKCGQQQDFFALLMGKRGLLFDDKDNYRDVAWLGTTDDGCVALAELLGWKDELLDLVKSEHKKIDEANSSSRTQGESKEAASKSS